jgi:hypothetical protein
MWHILWSRGLGLQNLLGCPRLKERIWICTMCLQFSISCPLSLLKQFDFLQGSQLMISLEMGKMLFTLSFVLLHVILHCGPKTKLAIPIVGV